jgi:hypothetical protein
MTVLSYLPLTHHLHNANRNWHRSGSPYCWQIAMLGDAVMHQHQLQALQQALVSRKPGPPMIHCTMAAITRPSPSQSGIFFNVVSSPYDFRCAVDRPRLPHTAFLTFSFDLPVYNLVGTICASAPLQFRCVLFPTILLVGMPERSALARGIGDSSYALSFSQKASLRSCALCEGLHGPFHQVTRHQAATLMRAVRNPKMTH